MYTRSQTPQHTSIKVLVVSIRWCLGVLKGTWGVLGGAGFLTSTVVDSTLSSQERGYVPEKLLVTIILVTVLGVHVHRQCVRAECSSLPPDLRLGMAVPGFKNISQGPCSHARALSFKRRVFPTGPCSGPLWLWWDLFYGPLVWYMVYK